MTQGTATSRQAGLRQAAAIIFALVAIVPLLVFAWTLHALDVVKRTEAQVGLSLSLAVALLGFWMFRMMLARMSEVVQALVAAVEQANRARRPSAAARAPPGPGTRHGSGGSAPVAASTAALDAARAKVIAPSPFATPPVSKDPGPAGNRQHPRVRRGHPHDGRSLEAGGQRSPRPPRARSPWPTAESRSSARSARSATTG